jgi:osmotically-inducible protein OsmY
MADRNWRFRNGPREHYRGAPDERQESYRQQEQFSTGDDWDDDYRQSYGQMGEGAYGRGDYGQSDPVYAMEWDRRERYPRGERGYGAREGGYPSTGHYNYGPARIEGPGRGFASFTSEDQGGRDFTAPTRRRGYGWPDYRTPSGYGYPGGTSPGQYDRDDDERGFFDRAADEVSSWFGDEDAARRRELDHTGRGPENYTRSDERILEDACDKLTDDWGVDARNVQVTVDRHEVTLDGTVPSRRQKRRAEDCVEAVSGVTHVQNNLRVEERRENREVDRAQGERTTGGLT